MRIFKTKSSVNINCEQSKNFLFQEILTEKNFTYGQIFNMLNRHIRPFTFKIIDVGCGDGNISLYLAKKNNFVTGIDLSNTAISMARKKAKILGLEKKTTFLKKDANKFKFKKKFNIAICIEVLEHVKSDNAVLKNIYDSLSSQGKVIITVPSKNAPLYKLNEVKKYDKSIGHLRRYSQEELVRKLKNNKFKVVEIYGTEGILRNSLFFTKIGRSFLRLINRFHILSIFAQKTDNVFLKIFGESQITVCAERI